MGADALQEWPCSAASIAAARQFLQTASGRVVLAPDRDADGLSAGAICHSCLTALGTAASLHTYFLPKGANVFQPGPLEALRALQPDALIVLDQGSRGDPLLPGVPTLVLDHHQSTAFPPGAQVVSAYGHEPVATSALLAYIVCQPLLKQAGASAAVQEKAQWLAALGTFGDLGASVKWQPPLPDLAPAIKRAGKTKLTQAVSLLNAARRGAACDAAPAWQVLQEAAVPADIADARIAPVARLQAAKEEVAAELARCCRAPPRFSDDGRVALVMIESGAQVHPLIAQRWSTSLKGPHLQMVMVANTGYLPGRVNYASRIARCAAARGESDIDLIALFREAAQRQPGLLDELGSEFGRGHAQATGGSSTVEAFQRLKTALGFEEGKHNGPSGSKRSKDDSAAPSTGNKKARTLADFGFVKK